jgi:large subunit ribosomal protein L5
MTTYKNLYNEVAAPLLQSKFAYKSKMQIPKITKIVVNAGVGEAVANSKVLTTVQANITNITGQKAMITKSKKSIAAFKLRKGLPIGCMVTLRNVRMYEFMERLVKIALPRQRDFRGIPKTGFDGRGNYTFGIKEEIIFPEVTLESIDKVRGMDITFVTSCKTDEESFALLEAMGMPFRK